MSFRARAASFRYALQGLATLLATQPNARVHLVATVAVVSAGLYFQLSRTEWAAVSLSIVLVIGMEAMNTAVEQLIDLVSPDYHPLAGRAKDLAAAAVLLASLGAAVVGGLVFLPKIFAGF